MLVHNVLYGLERGVPAARVAEYLGLDYEEIEALLQSLET